MLTSIEIMEAIKQAHEIQKSAEAVIENTPAPWAGLTFTERIANKKSGAEAYKKAEADYYAKMAEQGDKITSARIAAAILRDNYRRANRTKYCRAL